MKFELSVGDYAFGASVAFLLGVLSSGLGWNAITTVGVATVVLAIATIIFHLPRACTIVLFIVVFAGSFYFHFFANTISANFTVPFNKEVFFRALIADEPESSGKFLVFTAEAQVPFQGEVTIFADPSASFRYGDLVAVRGIVRPSEYARSDPALFPQQISLIAPNHGFFMRAWMIDAKEAVIQKFNDALPADEAALLGAMTVGGTVGMTNALKNQMSLSGTSYLAAMYGYKMNILIFESINLLSGLIARRKRFFLALMLVGLFVLMTGADASAVRAAIMGCIALIAREAGRMPSMRNAIALTAVSMVLFDPLLIVQASFLLSFLSLIGIIYLGPPLRAWLRWRSDDRGVLYWKEAAILSMSSLLPIVPVLMMSFGQFSLLSFLSNVLVFPALFPLMLSGVALAASGFVSSYLAFFVGKFTEIFIWYALGVIRLFSVLVLPLPQIFAATWVFVAYYIALGLFIYHYGNRKKLSSSRGREPTLL